MSDTSEQSPTRPVLPFRRSLRASSVEVGDVAKRPDYAHRYPTKADLNRAQGAIKGDVTMVSACLGRDPDVTVSSRNPAAQVLALIADVDPDIPGVSLPQPVDRARAQALCQVSGATAPTWSSSTYSGGLRLVWLLETKVPVQGTKQARAVLAALAREVRASEAVAALTSGRGKFDSASFTPEQYFDKGSNWAQIGGAVGEETVAGALFSLPPDTFSDVASGDAIPFSKVAEEVGRRWPDMWGDRPFEPGQLGTSFWLPDFKPTRSAKVDEEARGMVTWTSRAPKRFYTWRDILGDEWCDRNAQASMAEVLSSYAMVGSDTYLLVDGEMIKVSPGAFVRALGRSGFTSKELVEKAMEAIDLQRTVRGVAPVYGCKAGQKVTISEFATVVCSRTSGPHRASADGDPDPVLDFVYAALGQEQGDLFLGWMIHFYKGLRKVAEAGGDMTRGTQGHAVYLLGGSGSGKTSLAELVERCAGRGTNAEAYLTGEDKYNIDMAGTPVWRVDDVMPPRNGKLVNRIKEAVAVGSMKVRDMRVSPYRLPWRGRVLVCANDDPDTFDAHFPKSFLAIIRDKVLVFKTSPPPEDQARMAALVRAALEEENVAAFCGWLATSEIPEHLREHRFGVRHYIHPELLAEADSLSYEASASETAEIWAKSSPDDGREVTARDIYDDVRLMGRSTGFQSPHYFSIVLSKAVANGSVSCIEKVGAGRVAKYRKTKDEN